MSGTHRGQKRPDPATRTRRNTAVSPNSGDPAVQTARNTRHILRTGTVVEIEAMLPDVPHAMGPINGPALDGGTEAPIQTPYRVHQRIDDRSVLAARTMLRDSGVISFLTDMVQARKGRGGAKARVTVEAVLVAMWLAANTNRPMLLSEFAEILFHCITKNMRRLLNVSDGRVRRSTVPRLAYKWDKAAAKAVAGVFRQMCDVIDPSDEISKREQQLWADVQMRGLTDTEMQKFHAHLDWVSNQLLFITYMTLPESVRRHDKGDRCIDGTPVPMYTRPRGLDHPQAMSMVHAANYVREGNHADPDEEQPAPAPKRGAKEKKGKKKQPRRVTKFVPALELHVLSSADSTPGQLLRFPHLFTSMTTDRPGMDPAGCARRMFAQEKKRGLAAGFITGDGLYAKAEESTFQIPAREAGFDVILPVLPEATGVQGAHESGFLWIDGTAYCPAITDDLRTIIDDFRAKRIDLKTFGERVRLRKRFELVTKQNADEHGVGERIGCRAANHSLTVMCCHKPNSMTERPTLNRDGDREDNRPEVFLPVTALTNSRPPTICQVQTVTLKKTDHAKYRQDMPVGDEHTDLFNRLRQGHEGMNGFTKDEAREALGTSGRRRVRTKVAQQLFAAFLLAAANLRKIRSFFGRAKQDLHGYYTKRIPRSGEHARSGMPPGTPFKAKAPPRDPAA